MLNFTYLATEEDLCSIDDRQLSTYRYIACIDLGARTKDVSRQEMRLICTGLSGFLREECIILLVDRLKNLPEDAFMKDIFSMFELPSAKKSPQIGILTLDRSVHDLIYLKPFYYEIDLQKSGISQKYPVFDAINQGLAEFKTALFRSNLEDMLPEISNKSVNSITPNGRQIRQLRGEKSQYYLTKTRYSQIGKEITIAERMQSRAENYETISEETLQKFASYHNVEAYSLKIDILVLNTSAIKQVLSSTGLDYKRLAEKFRLKSAYFFTLLLSSKTVSSRVMRYLFSQLEKSGFLEKGYTFSTFINIEATLALLPDRTGETEVN